MVADSQRANDDSTVFGVVHTVVTSFRAWLATSWLASLGTTLTNTLATATRNSALTGAVRTLERYVCHSVLYSWLTAEPDPDVIVIDLRDTYTVGPVIAVLDRFAPAVERIWRGSLVRRATDRLRTASIWTWTAESRTVRLLATALEPPEPPDGR